MASTDPSKLESAKATSGTVAHTEYNGTGTYVPDVELVEAAVAAGEEEARQGRKALFAMYGPAVIYSCLLSLALVMEGMDVGLINNFFAHPAYKQKFGWGEDKDGLPFIPADWQTGIGLGNNAGSIIGLLLNGYLQSRFGSRRVYMVSFTGISTQPPRQANNMFPGRHVPDGLHYLRPLLRHQRQDSSRGQPPLRYPLGKTLTSQTFVRNGG
jgi:hypothetical protein